MALSEETVLDLIEVLASGRIQIRQATIISRDGEVISRTYHRSALEPGADLTGQDPRVVAIATAVWPAAPAEG